MACFQGCKHILAAHVKLFINPEFDEKCFFFHQLQVLFRAALYTFVTQTIFMFGVSLTQLQHSALLNLISFTWDHFVSLCRSHWMASLLSVGVISLWTSSNPALIFFRINGLMVRSHCAFAFLSLSLFKYSGLSIAVHY